MGNIWHQFIALPPVAKIGSLLGVVALAGWGWLKRKTIGAMAAVVSDAAGERFWSFVRRKLDAGAKPGTFTSAPNDRIYRGIFQAYALQQPENGLYPPQRFLTMVDGDTTLKIPVSRTGLFEHVQPGQFVEVDTKTGIFSDQEVVQRVRVVDKPKPRSGFIRPG